MIFDEGDIDCVEELKKPAKKVLKIGEAIKYDPFERRVGLWNEIRENYDRYLDGNCGSFLKDLDMHFRSQFDAALLVLATSFKENGEEFKPAERFSNEEIELYRKIERYNVFEILSIEDLLKRIVSRDDEVLELFRDYYVYMDKWVDKILDDPSLKLTIRFYLKRKWEDYKGKLNEAVSKAIVELDWFRKLISQWEKEAEGLAEKKVKKVAAEIKAEVEAEATRFVEEEKRKVEEEARGIEGLKDEIVRREEEVREKEDELRVKEEEIRKAIEELRGFKEKVEKGNRFVDAGRAKLYEMNFIGRIEHKLGKEVELFGKTFKLDEVREGREIDTSRYIGMKSRWGVLAERDAKNLPENRYVVVRLVEKKLLGGKRSYVLKAVFASRVDKYAEYGFDVDPLELKDVNVYVVDARDEAKREGRIMVLCLASPTGFEDAVKEHVNSEEFHRNFLSRYLSVLLVDLETGKLIYNPHDSIAKEFAKICEIEMDEEKKERTKRCVEGMMGGKDWITFKDALACGDEALVKAAFYEIAEEKRWKVRYVDGVGLVLMK